MNTQPIRQAYWSALNRWRRWRRPMQRVLNPGDPLEAMARHLAEHHGPMVMVDGGAHDGAVARQFARRFPGLIVHAFEPNPELLPAMQQNLRDVPHMTHALALAATSGEAPMQFNSSPMTSSLLPRGEAALRFYDDVTQPVATRTVPTISLDDWFTTAQVQRVDILKLDLQGYELQALRGAEALLASGVRCIYTEVSFVPIYEGAATFGELDAFLSMRGYRLLNLFNLATRLPEGQLTGGDALYVSSDVAYETSLSKAA